MWTFRPLHKNPITFARIPDDRQNYVYHLSRPSIQAAENADYSVFCQCLLGKPGVLLVDDTPHHFEERPRVGVRDVIVRIG